MWKRKGRNLDILNCMSICSGFADALLIVAMKIELKALREGVILIKF